MDSVIYAAPFLPPEPPAKWQGLTMLWEDPDGVSWDLVDGSSGLVMLPGVRGLHMPSFTRYIDEAPTVHGSRFQGYNVPERECFWPLQVYSDQGSQEWLNHEKKFWATMRPTRTGRWIVIQPNGKSRWLTIRFTDDGQTTYDHEPALATWNNYGLTFKAEQPFWVEDDISRTFRPASDSQFFSASSSVLSISAGSSIDGASIFNPGDEPAWPIWTIEGPTTTASVGVNGVTIDIPFAIPSGEKLVIDTSPTAKTAVMDGVDKIPDLESAQFAKLPENSTSELSLAVVGTGNVTVRFTPLFHRAW